MSESKERKVLIIDLANLWVKSLYVCKNSPEDHLKYIINHIRRLYKGKIYSAIYLVVEGNNNEGKSTYEKYKEGRHKKDGTYDHLRTFISIVCKYVKVVRNENAEGDFLVAELAMYLRNKGDDVTILSNDKDFLQLVQYGIHVAEKTSEGEALPLTDEQVLMKFKNSKNVPLDKIENILKYRVFKGDSSDKIPSAVRGMKDVNIREVINLWEGNDLNEDKLMMIIGKVEDEKVRNGLINNINNILRNYKLMNLIGKEFRFLKGSKYLVPKISKEELERWKVPNNYVIWS